MSVAIQAGVLTLVFLLGFAQTMSQRRQHGNGKMRIPVLLQRPAVYAESGEREKDIELSDEEKLYNYLLFRYNRAIRPVAKTTESVYVNVTFSLMQIHGLNEKTQVFRTYGWLVVVNRLEFVYECCPDIGFSKVQFTLFLSRRHRFFTLNLVLPCAMLSSLTLVTFLSPPDQGEKISLGISILLSFSVFLLSLSENMPKTSEKLPLFGIFTTFVMLMNTSSVMLTVLVLNLHHRNRSQPIPKWLRSLIFEGLARLLCMHSQEDAEGEQATGDTVYKYEDYRRNKAQRRRFKTRDGYSLASAAAQFRKNIKTTGLLLPGQLPVSVINRRQDASSDETNDASNQRSTNGRGVTIPSLLEENCKEQDNLLKAEYFLSCELQEWKRLAGIVDRLFFWLTFLSLIVVSAGMIGLLWAHEPLQ
ncbi:hypothetical protein LSH36_55g08048 [Paralvinella palmiformis]|uniref:Uncharacterized protein n=1 Tax=Paralvinella palmiformis TaxID=53620 RepID=A0AAD9K6L3_9ANNE|nr:hypothetical protein LSH36_55g08048 [Paralvinella palmiformis]